MFRNQRFGFLAIALVAFLTLAGGTVGAVDFEVFEFNDSDFTELADAANSINPTNKWVVDTLDLVDSAVISNEFFIAKANEEFADNFLQIADVTSGSQFIAVDVAGWEFFNNVVGQGEEIRFAFLDDTSGTDGSSVAAEVRIDRNTTTSAIELRGLGNGIGSSDIVNRATLNTAQSNPFKMVLELNKDSNTYEIFYKDDTNFSQSLGTGSVAPDRNGNSLRFVVNNNFGSDPSEFFSIDRVAVTDTNPLTDLLTFEVHRDTGVSKLINTSGATVSSILSVTLTSDIGADDQSDLMPFSGSLSPGQEVTLSSGDGPWIQNPTEDLRFVLNFAGGVTRSANVNFVGNNDSRFPVGDLDFDGGVDVDDWTVFIAGSETDLSGQSVALSYQSGDLDADGVNSIEDFGDFITAFDAVNGFGAFQQMLAGVPEPSSALLLILGSLGLAGTRRRLQ